MGRVTLIKKRKHSKNHGFLKRTATSSGRKILRNRRRKNRIRLVS